MLTCRVAQCLCAPSMRPMQPMRPMQETMKDSTLPDVEAWLLDFNPQVTQSQMDWIPSLTHVFGRAYCSVPLSQMHWSTQLQLQWHAHPHLSFSGLGDLVILAR